MPNSNAQECPGARHKAMPRWAKSLQTPTCWVIVSNAEVWPLVEPRWYSTWLYIHSVMAITFSNSSLIWPNKWVANFNNLSDSQYPAGVHVQQYSRIDVRSVCRAKVGKIQVYKRIGCCSCIIDRNFSGCGYFQHQWPVQGGRIIQVFDGFRINDTGFIPPFQCTDSKYQCTCLFCVIYQFCTYP